MTIERYRAAATEAEMLAFVQGTIAGLGGQSMHIRRADRQNVTGWPDVVGVVPIDGDRDGPHRLVAIEIKTRFDRRNPAQDEWLRRLGLVGATTAVLRGWPAKASG